jgi:hypothetical protein
LALLSACGGDDPCAEAVQQLCEKACTCAGDAACATAFGEEGSGIALKFDTPADCKALFLAGCEEGVEDAIDADTCSAGVERTTCSETGLVVPEGCGGG